MTRPNKSPHVNQTCGDLCYHHDMYELDDDEYTETDILLGLTR